MSPVTETWPKKTKAKGFYPSFLIGKSQTEIKGYISNRNTTTCSPNWLIYDVQDVPVVITRGNGTFSVQTELNPEQSFVLSVNGQCFQLFWYFNKCSFHLSCHIRPLDTWSHPTRQPKKKPAKYVFWTEKFLQWSIPKFLFFLYLL